MDAVPAENKTCGILHNGYCFPLRLTSDPDSDAEDDQAEDQEDDGARAGELRAHAGDLPEIGRSCENER